MKKALIIILVLAVFLTVGANAYGSDGRNNFINNDNCFSAILMIL